jgi:hypothetical protein
MSGVRGQVPGQVLRCNPPGRDRCFPGVPRQNSDRPHNQQLTTILPIVDLV